MTRPAMTIGLSGYARSGKDMVGWTLARYHDFTRMAWADPLREAMTILDPVVGVSAPAGLREFRYTEVLRTHGYEAAKDHPKYGPEIRRLMQTLGTEIGRGMFGDQCWIWPALKKLSTMDGPVVFTDTRFPNEADEIKAMGGIMVRIIRPGVRAESDHPSETALDDWADFDYVIVNDGSLEDLRIKVDAMIKLFKS